jgi:hypothetical protein
MEISLAAPPGGAPLAAQIDGEEWPPSAEITIEVEARAAPDRARRERLRARGSAWQVR